MSVKRVEPSNPTPITSSARPEVANDTATSSVDKTEESSLFDRYKNAKSERGLEIGVDRKTFDQQIAEQRKKIEARLGRKVRFEVQVENDKVRVVARKEKKKR